MNFKAYNSTIHNSFLINFHTLCASMSAQNCSYEKYLKYTKSLAMTSIEIWNLLSARVSPKKVRTAESEEFQQAYLSLAFIIESPYQRHKSCKSKFKRNFSGILFIFELRVFSTAIFSMLSSRGNLVDIFFIWITVNVFGTIFFQGQANSSLL